jgi:hypothetical protein
MGLVKQRKRQFVEVSAHFVKGLVSDYGDAAVVCEMLFYFCWSFRLFHREHEGAGCVACSELLN